MVYVIAKNGQPLMPTENHAKVRILLKQKKAKVLRRCPFTIKLLYDTTHYTQELTLGIDTGSANVGCAVVDSDRKIYYLSQMTIRNDIKKSMDDRRRYRRSRRNRKTRYRKPRFLNRGKSRRSDRLPPTMQSKLACHEREIRYIKKILPVTKLVLETGQFDPHLMKNPALANEKIKHWGYQKGTNYGYANTHDYVLCRDKHTCQYCKGKRKDSKLEVHHIIFRCNGGSDEEANLITLCHTCHKDLHDGKFALKLNGKKKSALCHATQMNIIRSQMLKRHPEAIETFGYVTKMNRLALGLSKDHYIDACVIAGEGRPVYTGQNVLLYYKVCTTHHDYQKTKGIRSEQKVTTTKIDGFHRYDKVSYFGQEYFIKGRMSSGYAILMNIHGEKTDFSAMPKGYKTPKLSNCKRLEARGKWMVISEAVMLNSK